MRLLCKSLVDVTSEDVLSLKANQVQESALLDYKKELPGNSDADKKEFLADVISFANSFGGTIVYGIEEEKDEQGRNSGIPGEIVGLGTINTDSEKLRFESIIRDGIDPRLNNVDIVKKTVKGKTVILLGIPRSLVSPHMIAFKRDGKFYTRNSSGKFQMDARESGKHF